ncbi:MAG: T9SS type A sorting domain-containing protein, partial [Bacteroidales bacterium]
SDNAYISFTENNSATQWEYIISDDSTQNSSTLTPITSSTNPIHISGLAPSTTYYYQMRSICNTNSYSSWSDRLIFSTASIPATIPYVCDFENTTENNNWRSLTSTASTLFPIKWIINTSAGNGQLNTGVNSAYISNDNSSYSVGSNPIYYTSFYRDIDFGETNDNYTLKFNWKSDGNILGADVYAGLRVYLMDVGNYIPTDVLLQNTEDTIGTFLGSGSIWQTAEIELNGITGIKRLCFIAFDLYRSIVNPSAIDNINLTISNCSRPQNLRATNTTTSSDIAFNANSDSYIVEYKEETNANYTTIEMSSNPIHLDNLSLATVYNVRLRGICGSDTSLYSEILTFTTPCSDNSVTSFPWIEGFENGISCWAQQRILGNIVWDDAKGYYYSENYFGGGYHAMPHTDTTIAYLYSNFAKTKLISPKLDISQLGLPYLSYWFVMEKQSSHIDTLKVYYRTNEDSSWTLLRTFYSSDQPSWRNDSVSLPYPSSTYQIAFEGLANDGFGVGLDDVKVYDLSPCLAPAGISANVAHNSTTISWTAGGSETIWQIKLNSNGTPIDIQNTPTYSFNNLTAGTSYTAYIRANCGSFYSPWVGITFANAVVTNINTSSLTNNSTTLIASYTQGSDAIIAKGFDWKLNTASNWNTQIVTDASNTFSYSLTGLAPNTMYDVRAYVMTATDTAYSSTIQFTTLAIIPPTVTTIQTTNISNNSATLNGTTTQETEAIQARGFEYKLNSTSSWTDAIDVTASGTTTITANVNGLTPNTQYDVRAYAQTASGRTYGNIENFTTSGNTVVLGEVTTQSATNIDTTSAVLNGTLVSVGNALSNIEVGFVYSTTSNPILGVTNVVRVDVPYVEGMTTYSSPITELQHSTIYYVKAFVNNSAGDAYGDEVTFKTDSLSGLSDIEANKFSISMYPNPATNTTKLVISGVEGETDIAINDVQGKLIYKTTAKAVNGKVEQTIDVNNFAKGVYYVRIQNQTTSRTQKLIVIY